MSVNAYGFEDPAKLRDQLSELIREGAGILVEQAVEIELQVMARHEGRRRLEDGKAGVVQGGDRPERGIQAGIGPAAYRRPAPGSRTPRSPWSNGESSGIVSRGMSSMAPRTRSSSFPGQAAWDPPASNRPSTGSSHLSASSLKAARSAGAAAARSSRDSSESVSIRPRPCTFSLTSRSGRFRCRRSDRGPRQAATPGRPCRRHPSTGLAGTGSGHASGRLILPA